MENFPTFQNARNSRKHSLLFHSLAFGWQTTVFLRLPVAMHLISLSDEKNEMWVCLNVCGANGQNEVFVKKENSSLNCLLFAKDAFVIAEWKAQSAWLSCWCAYILRRSLTILCSFVNAQSFFCCQRLLECLQMNTMSTKKTTNMKTTRKKLKALPQKAKNETEKEKEVPNVCFVLILASEAEDQLLLFCCFAVFEADFDADFEACSEADFEAVPVIGQKTRMFWHCAQKWQAKRAKKIKQKEKNEKMASKQKASVARKMSCNARVFG